MYCPTAATGNRFARSFPCEVAFPASDCQLLPVATDRPCVPCVSDFMDDQIFMGTAVALASSWGLFRASWLLEKTRKGQWLKRAAGPNRAGWIIRALLLLGIVFGLLLATDVVRPLDAIGP